MRKFSKVAKIKLPEEPVIEQREITEEDLLKRKVKNLMDHCLSVQIYGPTTRHQVAGHIKVKGKEMFLEALFDMLKGETAKENIKVLESIKSSTKDWEPIDEKINELKTELDIINDPDTLKFKSKIEDIYNKYGEDEELVERIVQKTNKAEKAYKRAVIANRMSNDRLFSSNKMKMISEKYLERYNQLLEN